MDVAPAVVLGPLAVVAFCLMLADEAAPRSAVADVSRTAGKSVKGGRAVLTGPVKCLPVSNSPVKLAAHPAKGWKVRSREIDLDGKQLGKDFVDGASLASDKTYTLTGTVSFAKGNERSAALPSMTFHTC